jgi:hypothetical protein
MYYSRGPLDISQNSKNRWSAGFKLSIRYQDGHGTCVAPHTGRTHHITRSARISADELGFSKQYTMTGRLRELLYDAGNHAIVNQQMPGLLEEIGAYREKLRADRVAAEKVLSSSFWLYVYDDDRLAYRGLVEYLTRSETNPDLRNLPVAHEAGLNYLYKRLAFIRSHPCTALWYVFWDDVWESNKDLPQVAEYKEQLDPRSSKSIAYQPKKRAELEAWLETNTPDIFDGGKHFISTKVLDALYGRLQQLDQTHKPTGRGVHDRMLSGHSVSEPRGAIEAIPA